MGKGRRGKATESQEPRRIARRTTPGTRLATPLAGPVYLGGMLLYLAADLIWASKIKATADALGIPCRPVRTMEMLEARLADSDVRALIVDLDVPEMAMTMIGRVRQEQRRKIRVLAFGPHVAREELHAAKEAGADDVLTRGAFDRGMPEVLAGLGGGNG